MMRHSFSRLLAVPFVLAVSALPLLAIPFLAVSPDTQKGIIAAGVLGISCCVASVAWLIYGGTVVIRRNPVVLAGVPLFFAACVSAIIAGSFQTTFAGVAYEIGTIGSIALFTLSVVAGAWVSPKIGAIALHVFTAATAIAASASALLSVAHSQLFGGLTLAGQWPDLSFMIAGSILIMAAYADNEHTILRKIGYMAGCAFLCMCFALFFEVTAAQILVGMLIVISIGIAAYTTHLGDTRMPVASVVSALCICAFLIAGMESPAVDVKPVAARPSFLLSGFIAGDMFTEDLPQALFGSGPDSFPFAWASHRPVETNVGPFGQTTPESAYSTLSTFAITFGLLGMLAFFFVPLSIISAPLRLFKRAAKSDAVAHGTLMAALAFVWFSYIVMLFYPVALTLFLVAGVATGVVARRVPADSGEVVIANGRLVTVPLALILLAAGVFFGVTSSRQFIAAHNYTKALVLLSEDPTNAAAALVSFEKAAHMWPSVRYDIDTAIVESKYALALFPLGHVPPGDPNSKLFTDRIYKAIDYSARARAIDPRSEEVQLARATLFIKLISFQYPDAAKLALQSTHAAARLSPTDPQVPYLQALLDHQSDDDTAALADLNNALALKPDYSDALKLREEILQQ